MFLVKSSSFAMGSMVSVVLLLSLFLQRNGISCQIVYLRESPAGHITSCSSGLRAGQDNYTYEGTIDGTGYGAALDNLADFYIKTAISSSFVPLCTVNLVNCNTATDSSCYCASRTGDVFSVVANRRVTSPESNAEIILQFQNATGPNLITNKNTLKIPQVYDMNAVTSQLSVDGSNITCPMNITYSSVMNFKCQKSPSPCNVTLTLDNIVVESGDGDITYSVPTSVPYNTSHSLVFSYSVCGGSPTSIPCTINIEPPTSTNQSFTFKPLGKGLLAGFCIGLVDTVVTAGAILYLVTASKTSSHFLKVSVGFLVFGELLCVIMIILFAQTEATTNDPEPGSKTLAVWKILLITYCVVQGGLLIAAFVAGIKYYKTSNPGSTFPSNGLIDRPETEKSNAVPVLEKAGSSSKENSHNANKSEGHDNTEEKKKLNVNFELREQTSNNNVSTSDKSNDILDKSEKRKSKERKHKKKSKESKGNKRELPLPNINNTEVDGKNDE